MKTLREKYIEALTKVGCVEIKRTSKWIVFNRNQSGFYYIGKSGSLRVGTSVAASIPVNSTFKSLLLQSIS